MNRKLDEFSRIALNGVISQGIASALGFSWFFLLGRTLSQVQFGQFLIYSAALNTISILTAVGIQHSIAISSGILPRPKLFANGLVLMGLHAVFSAPVAFIFGLIAVNFEKLDGHHILYVCLTTVSISLIVSSTSMLRSLKKQELGQNLTILQSFFFTLSLIPLFVDFIEPTLGHVIACYLFSTISTAAISLFFLYRQEKFHLKDVSRETLGIILKKGLHAHFGNMLKEAMYRSDLYLVGILLGAGAVGQYGVVLKIVEIVGRIIDPVGLSLLYYLPHTQNSQKKRLTQSTIKTYMVLIFVLSLPLVFLSPQIILLVFGPNYSQAGNLLQVGILATVPLALWKFLANYWISIDRTNLYILSAFIGASLAILLNVIFLPLFGLKFAPINLVVSYSLATIPLYLPYRRGIS